MGNMLGCKADGGMDGSGTRNGSKYLDGNGGGNGAESAVLLPRQHHGAVQSCEWWGKGAILTGGDDGLVTMTSLRKAHADPAKAVRVFRGHEKAVNSIHMNRRSGVAYSASRDMTLKSWKSNSASAVGNFMGHSLTVMAVGCDRDGLMVASGGRDYAVKVWDANTCQCTSTNKISRNLVTCLKFWKDGSQKFCQGSEDLTMRVWDVRNISNQSTHAGCSLTFGKYVYFPLDTDVSSCGTYVISSSKGFDGSGCEGRIWDVRKPETPVFMLDGHQQDAVGCCFVSSVRGWEGKIMCTVSKDLTVRLWDTYKGTCLSVHEEAGSGMWTSVRSWEEGGKERRK